MGIEQTKWADKKEKKKKKREEERKNKKTEQRERKKEGKRGFPLLFKIYENQAVGFRWNKR